MVDSQSTKTRLNYETKTLKITFHNKNTGGIIGEVKGGEVRAGAPTINGHESAIRERHEHPEWFDSHSDMASAPDLIAVVKKWAPKAHCIGHFWKNAGSATRRRMAC
jgi:hypothetical protein